VTDKPAQKPKDRKYEGCEASSPPGAEASPPVPPPPGPNPPGQEGPHDFVRRRMREIHEAEAKKKD
jgi:hypothetical protein